MRMIIDCYSLDVSNVLIDLYVVNLLGKTFGQFLAIQSTEREENSSAQGRIGLFRVR